VELTLLPPILLALAEQRSLDAVLTTIVEAVATQPDVALARVWLRDDDRACPVCSRAGHRSIPAASADRSSSRRVMAYAAKSKRSLRYRRIVAAIAA